MKKKYGLFTILTIMLLLIVIATYFINGRNGSIQILAIGDVLSNYIQSFYFFFDTAIFLLVVGGFYGFLNRVPGYKKLVKKIAEKVNSKSKIFIIAMTIIFALLSSLTGLNVLLLLFIPFVVSIILLLGYDKLVAISTTIGGTIAGLMGGILLTLKDASNYYAVSYTTLDKLVGLETHWGNLVPKILLLVVITGLLVFYILGHIKKVENKEVDYKLTKSDNLFIEIKDRKGNIIKEDDSKVKIWPIALLLGLFLVILILGYLPLQSLFGLKFFDNIHTHIATATFANGKYVFIALICLAIAYSIFKLVKIIKKDELFSTKTVTHILLLIAELFALSIFAIYSFELITKTPFGKWVMKLALWESSIYSTLITANITAFGTWSSVLGNYIVSIMVLLVLMLIIKTIYKVTFEEAMDGFIYGMKKMIPATLIVMLGFCSLVCAYNNGFFETIITNASKQFGDNVVVHSLLTALGSIMHTDFYYTATAVFTPIVTSLTKDANLSIYVIMFQSVYGLIQLVGPTSILLIVGLTYLDVPYKTWLKYIWRFIIELIIVILIALMVVSLL